jgi:sulfide:quinone oxidoreductase
MEINKLTENLSVSPQITAADIDGIAAQGFKTILCNRPDGEADDQPDYASLEAAAIDSGVNLIYQPVSPKMATSDNVVDFANTVNNADAPILAYCRTGTRCTILWALGESANGVAIEDIVATAAKAGYDLSKQAQYIASAAPR